MTKKKQPRLLQPLTCGQYVFAFEEYWVEDNDGFCSTDFLWEKHTRLKVFPASQPDDAAIREFPFDSEQRETGLSAQGRRVFVTYWPSYQTRSRLTIDADTLEILEENTEHGL